MRSGLAAICLLSLIIQTPAAWGEISGKVLDRKPWVERSVCLICHAAPTMKPAYRKVVPEWRKSVHYHNGIGCSDCHGGDPHNAALAMSPKRGFVGVPTHQGVMQFCGKCHIDILKSCCMGSAVCINMGGVQCTNSHCVALWTTGKGPNCVTCHGAHDIKKANINLINPQLCGRCHSYGKAKVMKAVLWETEVKIENLHKDLKTLQAGLISTSEEEQVLYRTQESYRSLFHTVDVKMVKDKTAEYDRKLDALEAQVQQGFQELRFRRNFSMVLLLLFFGLAITIFLSRRGPD
jgi:hypothetical protein